MNLLALTTSTAWHGAWLQTDGWSGGGVQYAGPGVPRRLSELIWDLFAQAGIRSAELHAVACDVGPGSFTGLRQGLAIARALAWAHGLPAIAVGSLEALVAEVRADGFDGPAIVALPARSGQQFVGWSPRPGAIVESIVADRDADAFWRARAIEFGPAARPGSLVVAGSPLEPGTPLHESRIRTWPEVRASHATSAPHPLPARIAAIALAAPADRLAPSLQLVPCYLAPSDAEVLGGHVVDEAPLVSERR